MTMMQPRPRPDSSTALLAWTMLLCLPLALTTRAPAAVDNQTGEQIYQQQCLSCHGKQGEGSKTYGHPLEGDRSVGQLAKYIAKSMPDDDPGTCEGEDAQKVAAYIHDAFYTEDRPLLEEHATFVREMEQELKEAGKDPIGHAVLEIEPGVKEENDNIPRISKMQIELMVQSFAADFARIATLQCTNSVGGAKMHWIGVSEGHHELSHHPESNKESVEKLTKINKWFCEQLAYLTKRLAETPEPGGGGSLLDNTLIVWTNELGKGNSHTLDNIPFVLVGNGLDFKMGRSLKFKNLPHNRLLLSLAQGMGHNLKRFGNPDFCGDGGLPGL